MISKNRQSKIVKTLSDEIDGLELITLFGSAAGIAYQEKESDIDIAFLASKAINNIQRWGIQEKLASLLNSDVDLVDLSNSNDVLRFEVIAKGRSLFIKPSSKMERFLDGVYINYIQLNEDRAEIIEKYA